MKFQHTRHFSYQILTSCLKAGGLVTAAEKRDRSFYALFGEHLILILYLIRNPILKNGLVKDPERFGHCGRQLSERAQGCGGTEAHLNHIF